MDIPPFPLSSNHHYHVPATAPSCDLILNASADDHHLATDTTPGTTTTPPVYFRTTGNPYNTRSTHGAIPIDMTPQDEDALSNIDHGGGGSSISAFAAVSHYPYVEPEESEQLAVDEVVNVHAVFGRGRHVYDFGGEREGRGRGSVETQGYIEGRGRQPWTVEEEDEGDSDVGMSSLSSPGHGDEDEDDPDDTHKFYPDAVTRRDQEWPGGGVSLAGVPDVDYGGFHWSGARDENEEYEDDDNDEGLEYDYESTSQSEDMNISQAALETHQDNSTGAVEAISISGETTGPLFGFAVDEFPVTSTWFKVKSKAKKIYRKKSKYEAHRYACTNATQHTNATLQSTSSSTNGPTNPIPKVETTNSSSRHIALRPSSVLTVRRKLSVHQGTTGWTFLIFSKFPGGSAYGQSVQTLAHSVICGIVPTTMSTMRRMRLRNSSTDPSSTSARRPCI